MREGKKSIGPWMKHVHSNLNLFCTQTNGRVCILKKQEQTTKSVIEKENGRAKTKKKYIGRKDNKNYL